MAKVAKKKKNIQMLLKPALQRLWMRKNTDPAVMLSIAQNYYYYSSTKKDSYGLTTSK